MTGVQHVTETHPLCGLFRPEVGALFYFTLLNGKPRDFQPVEGYTERGYHATSLYCLQRAVHGRSLTPGPGQLSQGGVRTDAVHYHRERFCHMTLQSCNHYIALADGPWFYAPVLLLEVKTDDPSLWTATGSRLPTSVRHHALTYPLAHSVEGFFVHMVHAAELRYVAPKCGTFNLEGAWSPGLELPAELSWAALVSRSRELAGDCSFVSQ